MNKRIFTEHAQCLKKWSSDNKGKDKVYDKGNKGKEEENYKE